MKLNQILGTAVLGLSLALPSVSSAQIETSPTLKIQIPAGNYESYQFEPGKHYIGAIDPRPSNVNELGIKKEGVTFIQGGDVFADTTLENILFHSIEPKGTMLIKDCYFDYDIYTSGTTQRNTPLDISVAQQNINGVEVEGSWINGYRYGTAIGHPNVKFRDCTLSNNKFAIFGDKGLDFGTEEDFGNNLFYNNETTMRVTGSLQSNPSVKTSTLGEYRLQGNWFYKEGVLLDSEESILDTIVDVRTSSRNPYTNTNTQANDIYVVPFHTEPNSNVEAPSSATDWEYYY